MYLVKRKVFVKLCFLKNTYHIITIENAEDIEAKVKEEMKGLPDSWLPVTHFQLVYSGNSA